MVEPGEDRQDKSGDLGYIYLPETPLQILVSILWNRESLGTER